MGKIRSVTKMTENRFLNMYHLDAENRLGGNVNYYVASRASEATQMKLVKKDDTPDGVAIYSLYGEKRDRIVLVHQYRYAIDDYIYEFPAGLVEKKEDFVEFSVQDYGAGMATEDLTKVFSGMGLQKRKDGDSSRGLGLGMSICKIIIEAHSGQIFAENTAGKGLRVAFRLPMEEKKA